MNPSKFDFNQRFYNYPSLHIYITGLILKISQFLNFIEIRNDKGFYGQHILYWKNDLRFNERIYSIIKIVKNVLNTNVAIYSSIILSFTPKFTFYATKYTLRS